MAVTDYVESLAAKYDTFGLTREFYTSLGTTVTLNGGDYGWCMDQDATVVALLNALADGYQGTMEPEYLYTAKSRDTNDIGDTYVEILHFPAADVVLSIWYVYRRYAGG